MKKLLFFLVILVFLCSCATLQPRREVVDNIFYSSHPKAKIKVPQEFEYLGQLSWHREGKDFQGLTTIGYDYNPYIFKASEKTLIIDIKKTQYYFVPDLLSIAKNKLEYGTCKLGNKTYQYYTKLIKIKRGSDHPIVRFFDDKGYVIPNCVLRRTFMRVVGTKGNTMINIRYFERLPDSFPRCVQWKNRESLSKDQVEYLNQFCSNSDAAFEVLE